MIYIIPAEHLNSLSKKVKHIENKGAHVVFEVGEVVYVEDDHNIAHKCYQVDVEGEYKIEDWEFVAVIEHTEKGNIIRKVANIDIPEKYKTTPAICEHCNTIKNRKDTYLVHNVKTNDFKQVGKTCLKQYTDGLSAEVCARIAEFIDLVEDSENNFIDFGFSYGSTNGCNSKVFKKLAYKLVKKNGYVSGCTGTVNELVKLMISYKDIDLATDEDIDAVNNWVETVNTNYDYFYNAQLAWRLDYIEYRHFALIASLINTYFKHVAKEKAKELKAKESTSTFVGEVGQKVTFTVASTRVLYTKYSQYYHGDDAYVYEIVCADGNVFIWSTTKEVKENMTITATIKEHKEYNGIKQTVITRGKEVK